MVFIQEVAKINILPLTRVHLWNVGLTDVWGKITNMDSTEGKCKAQGNETEYQPVVPITV